MEETDMDSSAGILGEKRPFEDSIETDLGKKKARGGLKEVAEMVLVLAAMEKMRAGRKPTAVEVEIMAEARGKLVEICEGFAPKDVFPTDGFRTVIEDLGLDRKSGCLPPKMSISQKLEVAKLKMENPEVFPRSFQNHSSVVNASSTSNSRSLPYQLPTSEVRPLGSNFSTSSHLGRGSTTSPIEQAGRPHLKSDGRSNANSVGDHKASHTPTWSIQSQSTSFNKANGAAHLTDINHHKQRHMNFPQPTSANTHNEIAKIVKRILQPHIPDRHTWNPPSRDYMNKPLTCQTCKTMINEVHTVLICDACEKGYHLRCLQCNPKSIFGDDCREWHCAKCLAISNGKPLPLKYGRVMKNINATKRSTSLAGNQQSLEKKVQSSDENFNQRLMSANGDSVSQTSAEMQISGTRECGTENVSSEKCQSNLRIHGNHQDANGCSKSSAQDGIKLQNNPKGENGENEVVEGDNIVKKSESCTIVRENEGSLSSSMHDVEWVGGVINETDGKMYYGSCCISGTTYKLQDYALFSSTDNNLMPNKLQGMWEDIKTNKKWVTVTRCFFPDDLPDGLGRPCAPDSDEVYESNHEATLAAGLINGPCKVLPPRKFAEERVVQTRSKAKAFDKPERIFLCKWFYDEKKRSFRDITC